jgi:uncharacterized protein DUF1572
VTFDPAAEYLATTIEELRKLEKLAARALEQVSGEEKLVPLSPDSNSIAIILKHMAGNMRSRWTDFLETDGEKPDRNRDMEFEVGAGDSLPEIEARWQAGWDLLFRTLESLRPEDLGRTVIIRGERMSVLAAVQRQLAHYASHVGQIVLLAKHWTGPRWRTLSVPKRKPGQTPG